MPRDNRAGSSSRTPSRAVSRSADRRPHPPRDFRRAHRDQPDLDAIPVAFEVDRRDDLAAAWANFSTKDITA